MWQLLYIYIYIYIGNMYKHIQIYDVWKYNIYIYIMTYGNIYIYITPYNQIYIYILYIHICIFKNSVFLLKTRYAYVYIYISIKTFVKCSKNSVLNCSSNCLLNCLSVGLRCIDMHVSGCILMRTRKRRWLCLQRDRYTGP